MGFEMPVGDAFEVEGFGANRALESSVFEKVEGCGGRELVLVKVEGVGLGLGGGGEFVGEFFERVRFVGERLCFRVLEEQGHFVISRCAKSKDGICWLHNLARCRARRRSRAR